MTLGLSLLAGLCGVLLALGVLWPLRTRGRAGFAAACISVGVVAASLYLLVGEPRAVREVAATPTLADLHQGVQALEQALQRDPQRADGWVLLGRSRSELGQTDGAADAFARAVTLAPDDAGVLVEAAQMRAQADAGKRFDDTALQWLQHALAVQPDAERAAWLMGIALRQRGRDAEAVQVWSALLPRLQAGAASALQEQISIARAASGDQPPSSQEKGSPRLKVRISLPAGFDVSQWPDSAALFVLARVAGGSPMPVAVKRFPLSALPETVELDDADSPMPTEPLSAQVRVEVVARLSHAGNATRGDGDLESIPVAVDLPHQDEIAVQLR